MTTFAVDGVTYELLGSDELTFGEADAMERVTKMPMGEITELKRENAPVSVLRAYIWISMKRKNPVMAYAELEDVPVGAIDWTQDEEPEADQEVEPVGPTSPGADSDAPAAETGSQTSD